MTTRTIKFINSLAATDGLSEGYISAGYVPLAHIEMDEYACNTLKILKNKII